MLVCIKFTKSNRTENELKYKDIFKAIDIDWKLRTLKFKKRKKKKKKKKKEKLLYLKRYFTTHYNIKIIKFPLTLKIFELGIGSEIVFFFYHDIIVFNKLYRVRLVILFFITP